MEQYAENLVRSQDVEDVDAISGVAIAYSQFNEAVQNALKDAAR
jgi:major membrane immunogen (membrane-anchored lipoprotein)